MPASCSVSPLPSGRSSGANATPCASTPRGARSSTARSVTTSVCCARCEAAERARYPDADVDGVAGLLADRLTELGLDREAVRPVALRHQRAVERLAVDDAADLHE